jgi:hypothetical protein
MVWRSKTAVGVYPGPGRTEHNERASIRRKAITCFGEESRRCSGQLLRQKLDRVAYGKPAALNHLRMHAEFHVSI